MTIALGSDHAGFSLKNVIRKHLEMKGIQCKDYGTFDDARTDYVQYGEAVALAVSGEVCERGIIVCGSGIGISIAANKVKGIRAALCADVYSAYVSRRHNDANVLALGARVTGEGLALMIVDTWLETEHAGGRHQERVNLIRDLESKHMR